MAITRVQQRYSDTGSMPVASLSLPFSSNVTAGNWIVVVASGLVTGGSSPTLTITDSQGNTYHTITSQTSLTYPSVKSARALVGITGACTVTVTPGVSDQLSITIAEYSGSNLTVDTNSSTVNGTITTSGTITGIQLTGGTVSPALLVNAVMFSPSISGLTDPSSPWSQVGQALSFPYVLSTYDDVSGSDSGSPTAAPQWGVTGTTNYTNTAFAIYEGVSSAPFTPIDFPVQSKPLVRVRDLIVNLLETTLQVVGSPFIPIEFPTPKARPRFVTEQALSLLARTVPTLGITSAQQGNSRIANAITGYNLYVGSGAIPDLTQAPTAFSATLPFTHTLTVPGSGTTTYYILVQAQDEYGLVSQNQHYTTITIDNSGNQVFLPATPPTNLLLYPQVNSIIRVLATYPGWNFDDPTATSWNIWISNAPINTSNPTTAVVDVTGPSLGIDLASYAPGLWYVGVALFRSTDNSLSTLLTGTVTMPAGPNKPSPVAGGAEQ